MNKTNSQFNLLNLMPIIIIVSFLFSIILGIAVLWPKFQDLKALKTIIEEKTLEFRQQQQYFSKLEQINSELGKYERELAMISSALPETPSLPSLFNFLQKAGSQSGLVLKGISPFAVSFAETAPQLKETQFSLDVVGSYSSFKNFISVLEKSGRLIEVENIFFFSSKEENPLTFNLKIKIYSY